MATRNGLAIRWGAMRQLIPRVAVDSGVPLPELWKATEQSPWHSHHPCLPQGAPTSPALSNLLSKRLDRRFEGLARKFEATYSRYADDITLSGGAALRRGLRRLVPRLKSIVHNERFDLAPGKFRVSRKSGRQAVTGLVVNRTLNVPMQDYRALRAILHNCGKTGPATQNRTEHSRFREHLQGRIAHVTATNAARGRRLKQAFDAIAW